MPAHDSLDKDFLKKIPVGNHVVVHQYGDERAIITVVRDIHIDVNQCTVLRPAWGK